MGSCSASGYAAARWRRMFAILTNKFFVCARPRARREDVPVPDDEQFGHAEGTGTTVLP